MNFRLARARERGEGLSARETERAGRPARPRARDPRVARAWRRGRAAPAAPPARTSASARTRVVMASTLLQRCFIHTTLTTPPNDVSLFMLYLSAIR